ncbi:twin-arginine translocation signal domain-containing protein, partial [Patescibacteria group bacterium]|nr:twin-arginine translocation signal domain-containing protein [Patescibacteria group bacterium]
MVEGESSNEPSGKVISRRDFLKGVASGVAAFVLDPREAVEATSRNEAFVLPRPGKFLFDSDEEALQLPEKSGARIETVLMQPVRYWPITTQFFPEENRDADFQYVQGVSGQCAACCLKIGVEA